MVSRVKAEAASLLLHRLGIDKTLLLPCFIDQTSRKSSTDIKTVNGWFLSIGRPAKLLCKGSCER